MARLLRRRRNSTYSDSHEDVSDDKPPSKRQRSAVKGCEDRDAHAAKSPPVDAKVKAHSSHVLSSTLNKQMPEIKPYTPLPNIILSDSEEGSEAMSKPGLKRKRSDENNDDEHNITGEEIKSAVEQTNDSVTSEPNKSTSNTAETTFDAVSITPPLSDDSNNNEPPSSAAQQTVNDRQNAGEPQNVPNGAEPDIPEGPTLLRKALEAMKQKNRKQLITGDVMLIIDRNDLAKTIRVKHELLLRHAPQLAQVLTGEQELKNIQSRSGDEVSFLAVLKAGDAGYLGLMLVPYSVPISTPAPLLPAAEIQETVSEKDRADSPINTVGVRVKVEPGEDSAPNVAEAAAPPPLQPTDWVAAYESFFRILVQMPDIKAKFCKLSSDAKIALPLVVSLTAIAERYNCLPVIGSAIKLITSDWVSNRSLYNAIAERPEVWLALAIKLQNELAYKEAFVHLVGRYPNIEPKDLPSDVVTAIERESRELKFRRCEVDKQLLITTLKVQTSVKPKAKVEADDDDDEEEDTKHRVNNAPSEQVVSQHFEPIKYNTVNLFRDWLGEHVDLIGKVEQGAKVDSMMGTMLCDHPRSNKDTNSACLSVSGFYHLLHKGGDGYLPAEEVIASWNKDFLEFSDAGTNEKLRNNQAADIRNSLKALKEQAKKIAEPLVVSSLQYEGRESLPYLTCVGAGVVPWAEEKSDEDEDEMDCD